jgi:hypothetical protein
MRPRHEIDRRADRDAIAASMTAYGWRGEPIVIDDRAFGGDGGYLITGHHRVAAALAVGLASVPCITLADLCEAAGIDLDAYCDGSYDSEWEPVLAELPAEVRARYGIQF